jgi:hypothetical protein
VSKRSEPVEKLGSSSGEAKIEISQSPAKAGCTPETVGRETQGAQIASIGSFSTGWLDSGTLC